MTGEARRFLAVKSKLTSAHIAAGNFPHKFINFGLLLGGVDVQLGIKSLRGGLHWWAELGEVLLDGVNPQA